jgi:hypothetical protein
MGKGKAEMSMKRTHFVLQLVGVLAALAWLLAAPVAGADSKGKTKVKAAFENTGVQPAAEGEVAFKAKPGQSELEFEFEDLDPTKTYTLSCDGTTWATFQAGAVELHFASSPSPGEPMLPRDPRGASFALNDASQDVLTVVLSGPGEHPGERQGLAGRRRSAARCLDEDQLRAQEQGWQGLEREWTEAPGRLVQAHGRWRG